jgi:hypothetical protein
MRAVMSADPSFILGVLNRTRDTHIGMLPVGWLPRLRWQHVISTSEDGTASLSKMDSPRFPTVCVRSRRLPAPADDDDEGEDEISNISSSHFVLGKKPRRRVETLAPPPPRWSEGGATECEWKRKRGDEILKCKIPHIWGIDKNHHRYILFFYILVFFFFSSFLVCISLFICASI